MMNCKGFERFTNILVKGTMEYFSPEEVLSEQIMGNVKRIDVRVGGAEFAVVYRGTDTVREFMVRREIADSTIMELLERIGLSGIVNAMAKWGYVPKSVVVSYVVSAKSLYLLIEGVRGRVPTVRVSVREDNYEASASYCVVSEGENVCAYLSELTATVSELRKCVVTYIQ